MLCESYKAAKIDNPAVRIVSAGLAPTLGGGGAINDLTYLDSMYYYGLKNCADVIGMNGFGFEHAPDDTSDPNDLNFSRLLHLRQVMLAHGDSTRKAWALEVGWVRYTSQTLPGFDAYKVPEGLQARYIRRALQKAAGWSWMEVIFV